LDLTKQANERGYMWGQVRSFEGSVNMVLSAGTAAINFFLSSHP
jgi:hypothetical protein